MRTETDRPKRGQGELVALLALMTSLVALSTDAMLPALPEIGGDLGVRFVNDNQLVVSMLFFGLAVGQIVYGPVSDSIGRKPAILAGFALFAAGSLLCLFAASFQAMLAGRFLQGIGAAGPRIVTVALVRDQFEGRAMARIMSLVMSVFILVPVVAPGLGQIVLMIADWRAIFAVLLLESLAVAAWFALRQPETLPPERRAPLSFRRIALAARETCLNRAALGYTIAAGLMMAPFVGYLISAQQIFQVQYGLGPLFPVYFGTLALAFGGASLANARLVTRYGMRPLLWRALIGMSGASAVFLAAAWAAGGQPPLWALMTYLLVTFFCLGASFGNFNALALEPLGHIAGVAASVVGTLMNLVSLPLGTAIGRLYDGTVLPLAGGFALLATATLAAMYWAGRGRQAIVRPDLGAPPGGRGRAPRPGRRWW